jgi:hypothetical protein
MHAQSEGKEEEEKEDGEITVEERQQKLRDDHQAAQLELKVCCLPAISAIMLGIWGFQGLDIFALHQL